MALLLGGCALTSKATPIDFRYFSPEPGDAPQARHRDETHPPLRLGRVTSSASLRTRIVHRDSAYELGTYETLRWTDNPEVYVRRALARSLFEQRSFAQAVDGAAPAVDVELVAFEEVRKPKGRAGRVQLRYQLHDEHATLGSGVLTAERDASGEDIEHVVAAISAAMNDAAAQLASAVAAHMEP